MWFKIELGKVGVEEVCRQATSSEAVLSSIRAPAWWWWRGGKRSVFSAAAGGDVAVVGGTGSLNGGELDNDYGYQRPCSPFQPVVNTELT
jgi:hypothetical protein